MTTGGASLGPHESDQLISKQFMPQLLTSGSRSRAQPISLKAAAPLKAGKPEMFRGVGIC